MIIPESIVPLLTSLTFLSVPIYPVVQIFVLWRRTGVALSLSKWPLLPMGALWLFCIYGYSQGFNLYPLLVILASPFAILWLFLVGLAPR